MHRQPQILVCVDPLHLGIAIWNLGTFQVIIKLWLANTIAQP